MNKKMVVRFFIALVAVVVFFLFTQKPPASSVVNKSRGVESDINGRAPVSIHESASASAERGQREEQATNPPEVVESKEPTAWQPNEVAVATLRAAAEHGDARTPPMAPSSAREAPTAEELADPDLYLEYEARQQQQVFVSYLAASKKKISELEASIARAKAEGGVSADQLAEGQAKLEKLKAARDELISEHPELIQAEDISDKDSTEGDVAP